MDPRIVAIREEGEAVARRRSGRTSRDRRRDLLPPAVDVRGSRGARPGLDRLHESRADTLKLKRTHVDMASIRKRRCGIR
jgi:hypothetical protein